MQIYRKTILFLAFIVPTSALPTINLPQWLKPQTWSFNNPSKWLNTKTATIVGSACTFMAAIGGICWHLNSRISNKLSVSNSTIPSPNLSHSQAASGSTRAVRQPSTNAVRNAELDATEIIEKEFNKAKKNPYTDWINFKERVETETAVLLRARFGTDIDNTKKLIEEYKNKMAETNNELR